MADTENTTVVHMRVTRIEVIDDDGRSFARRYTDSGCYVQLQDDGPHVEDFRRHPRGGRPCMTNRKTPTLSGNGTSTWPTTVRTEGL